MPWCMNVNVYNDMPKDDTEELTHYPLRDVPVILKLILLADIMSRLGNCFVSYL